MFHFLVHFREAGVSWSVAGWFFFGEAFGVFVPEAFYFGFYFFVQPQHAQEVGDGHECNGNAGKDPDEGGVEDGCQKEAYNVNNFVIQDRLQAKEVNHGATTIVTPRDGCGKGEEEQSDRYNVLAPGAQPAA